MWSNNELTYIFHFNDRYHPCFTDYNNSIGLLRLKIENKMELQSNWFFIIPLVMMLTSQTVFGASAQDSGPIIPSWIKNNAKFWSQGQISDSDFVTSIQYLVKNGIIKTSSTPAGNLQNSGQIPQWVKSNARLWAGGQINDSDFAQAMQYLAVSIIQVSPVEQPSKQTSNVMPTTCKALDGGILPDTVCTPGASDPRVTQNNIYSTICVSGYAKTVRPPVSITEPQKLVSMKAYGFSDSPSNYEFDHLIPLEIGGAPDDIKNLWPESYHTTPNSYNKDELENYLHKQVCSGAMDLQTAQNEFATNWVKYWSNIHQNTSTSNFAAQNNPVGSQPTQTIQNMNPVQSGGDLQVDLKGIDTIVRGNIQLMTVTVTDGINSISGANVSVIVKYASGYTTKNFGGTTDSNGQYDFSWKIGSSSDPGTFAVSVSVNKVGYTSTTGSFSFQVISK